MSTVDNHGGEHDKDDGVHANDTSIKCWRSYSGYCGVDARFKVYAYVNEDCG